MNRILVIGSINIDLTIHSNSWPNPKETLKGFGFSSGCGGKGSNQAISAKRCGAEVKMIGCLGRDNYGEILLDRLKQQGVDASSMHFVDSETGVAMIIVCDAENAILVDGGANACFTPEMLIRDEEQIEWADYLVLQYEIPMTTNMYAAKLAKRHNVQVVVNPAPYEEAPKELFDLVDWFILNEVEASRMTGISIESVEEASEALHALVKLGKKAVITLGKHGCVYTNENNEICHMQGHSVEAIDTTGAGDSFLGAFLAKLEKDCVKDAISYATAVSALSVTRRGAADSIPTAQEVEEFLKKA